MLRKHFHEDNRQAWNEATIAHNSHKQDQAGFLRRGGHTLFPEELALLGDLPGRDLVHLQCNAGQDSLSLVQHGARVTGVDISDEAVRFAQQLSQDSGLSATFERADVFDWLATTEARFDIAFSSYGTICWLSDLADWAKGVARVLRPGGRLVLLDFHPILWVFHEDWSLKYDYFMEGKVMSWESGVGDYVAMSGEALAPMGYKEGVQGFHNSHPSHEFQWGVAEIIGAVVGAGLRLTVFEEYPFMNGAQLCEGMRELQGRRMVVPAGLPNLPLMFGLQAEKS